MGIQSQLYGGGRAPLELHALIVWNVDSKEPFAQAVLCEAGGLSRWYFDGLVALLEIKYSV